MSREERQASQCSGKRRFTSFEFAAAIAKRSNRRHDGAHIRPYHCRHCHGFHVGEGNGRQERRPRQEEPA